ncbi:hypothetical protein BB559_004220 [Furculomyces boomerangus]|uniref:Uncharacterized protein n=2 Tax=Harpellales TaxID=61421 RepID=A0A2T9YFZ5_9FUNG|nr:hypothetical protein BB559_005216 [Furculomyces boomerangus]PVU91240.1 hypothetical protein BB559_004220 [Furculomyces boomerangus]PWA01924.1 hypothetical protein BB558_001940 [Smittium angustum]
MAFITSRDISSLQQLLAIDRLSVIPEEDENYTEIASTIKSRYRTSSPCYYSDSEVGSYYYRNSYDFPSSSQDFYFSSGLDTNSIISEKTSDSIKRSSSVSKALNKSSFTKPSPSENEISPSENYKDFLKLSKILEEPKRKIPNDTSSSNLPQKISPQTSISPQPLIVNTNTSTDPISESKSVSETIYTTSTLTSTKKLETNKDEMEQAIDSSTTINSVQTPTENTSTPPKIYLKPGTLILKSKKAAKEFSETNPNQQDDRLENWLEKSVDNIEKSEEGELTLKLQVLTSSFSKSFTPKSVPNSLKSTEKQSFHQKSNPNSNSGSANKVLAEHATTNHNRIITKSPINTPTQTRINPKFINNNTQYIASNLSDPINVAGIKHKNIATNTYKYKPAPHYIKAKLHNFNTNNNILTNPLYNTDDTLNTINQKTFISAYNETNELLRFIKTSPIDCSNEVINYTSGYQAETKKTTRKSFPPDPNQKSPARISNYQMQNYQQFSTPRSIRTVDHPASASPHQFVKTSPKNNIYLTSVTQSQESSSYNRTLNAQSRMNNRSKMGHQLESNVGRHYVKNSRSLDIKNNKSQLNISNEKIDAIKDRISSLRLKASTSGIGQIKMERASPIGAKRIISELDHLGNSIVTLD